MLSILVYGQTVALLLGLLMFWAWLRWRELHQRKWAILIGVFAGFLAITRPADAICYALPIGVAMLAGLRIHALAVARVGGLSRDTPVRRPRHDDTNDSSGDSYLRLHHRRRTPFLAVQAIQNIGITNHLMQTPFSLYLNLDQPNANFGFHAYDPSMKPASIIAQKQVYYAQFIVPFIQKHTLGHAGAWLKEHLPQIVDVTLPARVMLFFVPIGLFGLSRDPRRWALVMTFPLFLVLYFGYPPFVEHYAVPFMPAAAMCIAMAPGVLRETIPHRKRDIYRKYLRNPDCVVIDVAGNEPEGGR